MFDFSMLIYNFVILLLAITVHEFAHGLMANKLGDPTARSMGRLTLNPLAHLDPLGALMMIFCGFGWARPVPVNPYYFSDPKRDMVLVSVAGPASNLLLAFAAATLYPYAALWLPESFGFVAELLFYCVLRNISFAVFNLIPFPPLDGSKILFSVLPNEAYNKFLTYERYGTIILLALSFTGVLGKILGLVINPVWGLYATWINFVASIIG